MIQNLILFLLLASYISGCKSKNSVFLGFQPGKSTYVSFIVKNCMATKSCRLFYNHTFPAGQETMELHFRSDTVINLTISLNHPLYMNLYNGTGHVVFFVIPDDTLFVQLDFTYTDSLKNSISYEGATGSISEYLTHARYRFTSAPSKNQNPEAFNSMIDSLYNIALITIDSLGHKKLLPEWFVKMGRINIKHEREIHKLNQYQQRIWLYDQFIPRDNDFFDRIDLSEMNYYWLENSISVLSAIRPDKYDTLLQQNKVTTEYFFSYCQDNVNALKGRVSDDVMSYFVAYKTSVLFMRNKLLRLSQQEYKTYTKGLENFMSKNASLINDTIIYNLLIKEKERKYKEVADRNRLVIGDHAPNFYLSDLNGDFVQLTDFKRKLVLLNFWGTYCLPCIRSIPDKNKLVEEFKNEEFVLINICTDSNNELWRQIIRKNEFKGVHLICKGNWNDLLRSGYNILSLPHYTIIDQNGRILINNARDSVEYYLKAYF